MRMPTIRDCTPDDLESLSAIALATGDKGDNASSHFEHRELLGLIYAVPYAILEPKLALVVEDEQGVAGYCVGALRTRPFERLLERRWWPALRQRYPARLAVELRARAMDDAGFIDTIHNPPRAPGWLVKRYPSHLHINLLPRVQGRGCGRRLLTAWRARVRELGSTGFHLGVSPTNTRAIGFYEATGLSRLLPPDSAAIADVSWFGGA